MPEVGLIEFEQKFQAIANTDLVDEMPTHFNVAPPVPAQTKTELVHGSLAEALLQRRRLCVHGQLRHVRCVSNTQNLAGKSPAQNQEGHHPVNPHKPSQTVIPI